MSAPAAKQYELPALDIGRIELALPQALKSSAANCPENGDFERFTEHLQEELPDHLTAVNVVEVIEAFRLPCGAPDCCGPRGCQNGAHDVFRWNDTQIRAIAQSLAITLSYPLWIDKNGAKRCGACNDVITGDRTPCSCNVRWSVR